MNDLELEIHRQACEFKELKLECYEKLSEKDIEIDYLKQLRQ